MSTSPETGKKIGEITGEMLDLFKQWEVVFKQLNSDMRKLLNGDEKTNGMQVEEKEIKAEGKK